MLPIGSLLLLVAPDWVARDGIGHKDAGGWGAFWPEYGPITITWLWFTAVAVVCWRGRCAARTPWPPREQTVARSKGGAVDRNRWSRIVIILGLVGMILGAVDPLEGSLIILPGVALVAAGVAMSRSRYRALAYWALGLAAAGIGLMFWISSRGGVGGPGRPMWWGLVLLPYPVGWLLGLVAAIRALREKPAAA